MRLSDRRYHVLVTDAVIALLCVAAWGAGYLYVATSMLTLIRITTLLSAVALFFSRYRIRPAVYYAVLLYFLVYTVHTLIFTFPYLTFSTAGGFVDFLLIGVFVYSLLTFATSNSRHSLKLFYLLCMIYVPAMCVMGSVEYIFGWHLPYSYKAEEPLCTACGFSYNPNDYVVLVMLALLYLLSYRRVIISKAGWWVDMIYLLMAAVAAYVSACRTAFAVEIMFVLFMLRGTIKRYWKLALICCLATAAAAACMVWGDATLGYRFRLYQGAFASLFDSYGFGFGIWGDRYYFSLQDNRDILHGLTNAHSYLLQILLTSGFGTFLAYILLIAYVMHEMAAGGRNEFWILPLFYLLLLFAPSSSLFLWGQYLTFVFIACYACHVSAEKKGEECR